jgi:hypothetical protein
MGEIKGFTKTYETDRVGYMQELRFLFSKGLRKCNKCKDVKVLNEFHKDKGNKATGYASLCKICKLEYDKSKAKHTYGKKLERTFGITITEYDQMLISQNNKCLLCERDRKSFNKNFAVDHCHTTGKVRGLLCQQCNVALGMFDDNPELIRKAANYVESHK